MAVIKKNVLVKDLHGMVGNYVFRRRGDIVMIYPKPERTAPFTDNQKVYQSKFGAAVKYAQSVKKSEEESAMYKKIARNMKKSSVYGAAISDFMQDLKFRKRYEEFLPKKMN